MDTIGKQWTVFGVLAYAIPLITGLVAALTGIGFDALASHVSLPLGIVLSLVYWSLGSVVIGIISLARTRTAGLRFGPAENIRIRSGGTKQVVFFRISLRNISSRPIRVIHFSVDGVEGQVIPKEEQTIAPGSMQAYTFDRGLHLPGHIKTFRLVAHTDDGKQVTHIISLPGAGG